MQRTIPAGTFKAQCLALLDDVRDSRTEIVVTKRGKPVARVIPIAEEPKRKSSFGHMKGLGVQSCPDEELFSTGEIWEADLNG